MSLLYLFAAESGCTGDFAQCVSEDEEWGSLAGMVSIGIFVFFVLLFFVARALNKRNTSNQPDETADKPPAIDKKTNNPDGWQYPDTEQKQDGTHDQKNV